MSDPQREAEMPEIEVEVWASNTLSRAALIEINDYELLPPDAETDEEGHTSHHTNYDLSNVNVQEEFNAQYFTIKELLDNIVAINSDMCTNGLTDKNLRRLNRIAEEAKMWSVDEEEVTLA